MTSDDGADTGLIGPGGEASEESVLALASPFDGGEIYIRQAVEQIAGYLDAEVLRVNLAFALGFDGPTSPLGACDPREQMMSTKLIGSILCTSYRFRE